MTTQTKTKKLSPSEQKEIIGFMDSNDIKIYEEGLMFFNETECIIITTTLIKCIKQIGVKKFEKVAQQIIRESCK